MKKFFSDFKAFISKGNIIDLAVAVIVGGAFGKITTSLVNDIIMPLISTVIGSLNFTDLKWIIKPADELLGTAEVAVCYGNFIQTTIDFLIISFFIFLALRILMNSKNSFKKLEKQVKKNKISAEDKEKLKALGVDLKDRKACVEALAKIKEEEKQQQLLAEANKPKIESQEDILKDIRSILQAQAKQTNLNQEQGPQLVENKTESQ